MSTLGLYYLISQKNHLHYFGNLFKYVFISVTILFSLNTINAKAKKRTSKSISFFFCPIDTCFKYKILLKNDSFLVEMKIGDEIRGSFKAGYDREPTKAFQKILMTKDTQFLILEKLTENSISEQGKILYVDSYSGRKGIKKFKITEVEDIRMIPKKYRKTYLDFIEIFDYYANRFYKKNGVQKKLKNE